MTDSFNILLDTLSLTSYGKQRALARSIAHPSTFRITIEQEQPKPTKYDLERIAKAKARRERRAKAHFRQHTQQL